MWNIQITLMEQILIVRLVARHLEKNLIVKPRLIQWYRRLSLQSCINIDILLLRLFIFMKYWLSKNFHLLVLGLLLRLDSKLGCCIEVVDE